MADSSVPVTGGSGYNIDTRTETTNSHQRQVIVLGDPALNNNVAAVASQDLGGSDQTTPGIVVRVAGSASVSISGSTGTLGTHITGTAGTLQVKTDPSSVLSGITSSLAVYLQNTAGTIGVNFNQEPTVVAAGKDGTTTRHIRMNSDGAVKVYDLAAGTVTISGTPTMTANAGSGTFQVFLPDTGHELGTIRGNTNTLTVFIPDTGHELGSIRGINNSISVHLLSTAGTIGVRAGQIDGSVAVYFSPAKPVVLADSQHTASIFTVSGSTSGGTTSGVTLVSPSANYNFKVFAYSIQTTGAVSMAVRFTNGAGSETELWRPLVTASGVTGVQGANLAVAPPGFLFATGTSTTLALKNDSGSLVHYSVSYIKESA